MRVKELIEQLQGMDPDAEVHFAYNFGDYWRTTVAPKVNRVEEGFVKYSEYHRMPKLVNPDDFEDEDEMDKAIEEADDDVVVLY